MSEIPLPDTPFMKYMERRVQEAYTADQMHSHAAAQSAAECEPLMAEIEALRKDGSNLSADNAALRKQVQALQSEVIRSTNFELDAGRVMRHEPMLNGFEDLWAIEAERDSLEWRLTNAIIRVQVLEDALSLAYGHLWCINNEPGTPSPLRSAMDAAYAARMVLRHLLTTEQRGKGINTVRTKLEQNP